MNRDAEARAVWFRRALTIADLDTLIPQLLGIKDKGKLEKILPEAAMTQLCHMVRAVFLSQPTLLELPPPITLVGDIHGQFPDLLRLFQLGGYPPTANYLFLGDYVDRGKQNLETICLLLAYKLRYPDNFFLLRGNHEVSRTNERYGFRDECGRRYSLGIWKAFNDVFNCMPFAALIGAKILCMHGGISPDIKSWDQLRGIQRPIDPPRQGLLIDLLWADPDKTAKGWKPNVDRGVSYVFGPDALSEFCKRMDIDLIARAHQVVQDGYELHPSRRLVTIFSAPNYCGEFDNAAAMMTVDPNLLCAFKILRLPKRHWWARS